MSVEIEKDEFLREIDELLGDSGDESTPPNHSIANGVSLGKEVGDIDLELASTLDTLTTQQPTPKTG